MDIEKVEEADDKLRYGRNDCFGVVVPKYAVMQLGWEDTI